MSQAAEHYSITVRRVSIEGEEFWRATVRELPDVAEFAETREEAIDLALDSIETLMQAAKEEGGEFPEPLEEEDEYSGRVTLRLPKSLHREIVAQAQLEDVSLNTYIVAALAKHSVPYLSQAVGVATGAGSDFLMRADYGLGAAYRAYFTQQDYYVGMTRARPFGLVEVSPATVMKIETAPTVAQESPAVAGNFIYPIEGAPSAPPRAGLLLHLQHRGERKVRSRA
jgi:predicted HicB family RNase H-like nuclease